MHRKVVIALVATLSGCGLLNQDKTIGQLASHSVPTEDVPVPVLLHDDIRNEYKALLKLVEDKTLQKAIERRIADVYMMEGDFKQSQGVSAPENGYYGNAIESYENVLRKYPEDPKNATVLYQLAKAYELEQKDELALGALEKIIHQYPAYPQISEVYFRKGDIHFRHQDYDLAESAYKAVVDIGDDSNFTNNAIYLMGWSRYKQSNYEGGLAAFNQVLDTVIPAHGKMEGLSKVDQALADDTLRIMSLSLSYAGGAAKLKSMFAGSKPRYAWMLYSSLGNLYLKKERFEDSAQAYRVFVEEDPTSDLAPQMHSKMIRAYIDGDFPQQVIPEKERYVASYGIHSQFWKEKSADVKSQVLPNLKTYLDELARHYHATGQKDLKAEKKEARSQSLIAFNKASRLYDEFVQTFPKDPKVPEMVFMGGEAAFDGGNYELAIKLYERTAYQLKHPEWGANAGYAAIIAYQKHTQNIQKQKGKESPALKQWQQDSVDSKLRFANQYRTDKRASTVMASAAEELIALKQYTKALEAAQEIVSRKGQIDQKLGETAYGVIALSTYELGDLGAAEQAYRTQLGYIQSSEEQSKVKDKIATVIYKQGEAAIAQNQIEQGVKHFLRIREIAPDSEIRVVAQYDAATHLLALEQYSLAITNLKQIQSLFPGHSLARTLPRKLAYAYEQNEQLDLAAQEYLKIYHNDNDADIRRDALFSAAELNKKANNIDLAIDQYKRWAHEYEQPFDTRMEARYNLAELYERKSDMNRHLYWLRRIIDGDKEAGNMRTDRSRYLGAWANAKYGDYWTWEFNNIRLRLPLEKHLPRKNEKLKNAQKRYELAAEYGVLEITTKSSYSIAELYRQFSKELMNAPKPKGLTPMEIGQYEMLLEEQAIPFEDLAIDIHRSNVERSWNGEFNEWIQKSFEAMARIDPIRFGKQEIKVAYEQGIR